MKKIIKIILLIIFGLLFEPELVFSQADESVVKAAFLEKFTRFIEWPEETGVSDTTQNFVIGIYGDNEWQNKIEKIFKSQNVKIKNKSVIFKYFEDVNNIEKTNLLLISSTKNELEQIVEITRYKPILTVSNSEGYAEKGVLINFLIEEGKVRFEINEKAVHESKLVMSYLLLRAAKIVNQRGSK